MKKIYILIILTIVLGQTGCDDFLDSLPKDKITDVEFWKTEGDATKFLTDIYSESFRSSGQGSPAWDEAMSDNSHLVWSWWGGQMQLADGTQDSYGQVPTDVWKTRYSNIRRCFLLLENLDKLTASDDFKQRIEGEARFLLAYNYHILVPFFGSIPLIDKVMTIKESEELTQVSREVTVDFILSELDKASGLLKGRTMDLGRVTWGACRALKARVLLNENQYPDLLPVTAELIGKYELNKVGKTPYADLFSGAAEQSNEIILSLPREKSSGSIRTGSDLNVALVLKGMSGGDPYRGMMPTGSVVDAYPMADGRLVKEAGSTYNPKEPYKDRDPRFYESIIYPTGQIRYYNSTTGVMAERLYDPEDPTTEPLQLYSASEPSATGYMWSKYVDWSPYAFNELNDCTNDIIIIRYADVLLMRAEALAEVNGAGAKNEVCDLLDMLRARCGGGLIHRENYNTKEALIALVRNERRIELANEGFRYFDLLRWKIAEKSPVKDGFGLSGELYGAYMRLDGVGKNDRTVLVDGVPRRYVETRFFNPAKHYLNPIPQSERDLNPLLNQNPNW